MTYCVVCTFLYFEINNIFVENNYCLISNHLLVASALIRSFSKRNKAQKISLTHNFIAPSKELCSLEVKWPCHSDDDASCCPIVHPVVRPKFDIFFKNATVSVIFKSGPQALDCFAFLVTYFCVILISFKYLGISTISRPLEL